MTTTPGSQPPRLVVRSPADLLAAVPYLLGFHPDDSVVVVSMSESRVVFAARADLPPPAAPDAETAAAARHLASVVARQGGRAVTVIGYGPADRVDPVLAVLEEALEAHRLRVVEALRAHDGRYWSSVCDNPECCPPEGVPYDLSTSAVAAAATYSGQVALPSRAAVAGQVAPVVGAGRAAMRAATERAEARLVALLDDTPVGDVLGGRAVRRAGERAVRDLLDRGGAGERPTDDEVAWAALLLTHIPVRDAAWRRTGHDARQLELWSDVVRRVEPHLVPAPASLLAFVAWRAGHGALANVALDRALAADPAYGLARLLRDALDSGVSPSAIGPWPPPRSGQRTGRRSRRRGRSGSGRSGSLRR